MRQPHKNGNKFLKQVMPALLAATCLSSPWPAIAQVDPANSATQVYSAPNGVPIVDIANPNAAGLSHNKYTNYNVDTRGLVLNNGDIKKISRASELAGQVPANLNLTREATVILNEVVAPNRSSLAGYTEVVGQQADVIVANPYGITCNGCGFINTPNVTLTTGNPVLSGAGALTGFQVDNGDILITGTGLDGSKQDYLALVARSIKLEGQVNADTLDVVAGANDWDIGAKTATARTATGTAPTYAVDSSALGGMYAGRIRLIATEAGVGVRMNGEAAASADDFTITSSGKVEIGNKVSAERDLAITTTASGADAVHTVDGKLSARRDLDISATAGEVHLEGGTLMSGRDMTVQSASLTDEKTATSGTDNNKRYAAGDLTLTQTGALSLDGTSLGTAGAFSATADTITVGSNGATIYGDTVDLSSDDDLLLNTAAVMSDGDMHITSQNGTITTTAGGSQGIESLDGNITLMAGASLTNGGMISADDGILTLRIDGAISNSGTMYASDDIDVADANAGKTATMTNIGTVLGDGGLSLYLASLDNSGSMQGTDGATVNVTTITNSGTLMAGAGTGATGTVTTDSLTNSGTLQTNDDLVLNVRNLIANSGKIIAGGDLTMRSISAGTTLAVTNAASSTFQAGGALSLKDASSGNNVTLNTQAGLFRADTLDVKVSSLTNSGTMQSLSGFSALDVTNTLTNSSAGKIMFATGGTGSGTVNANSVSNSGILQSGGALNLNVAGLTNAVGAKILSAAAHTIRGLTGSNYTVANSGLMQSTGGVLDIKGNGGTNAVTITSSGSAADFIGNSVDWNAGSISFADSTGVTATNGLTINASSLSLGGSNSFIVAGTSGNGDGAITVSGAFSNNGALHSGRNLTLTTGALTNTGTGGISALSNLTVSTGSSNIDNYGAFYAGNTLGLTTTGTLTNHDGATMDSALDMNLTADTFINYYDINAGRNMTIDATYFYNEVVGGDTRTWATTTASTTDTGWGSDPDWLVWGQSTNKYYTRTWQHYQYYAGGTPSHKPQILANNSLTITDFQSATNLGGVISAPTVNINTTRGGATFTNDGYGLTIENKKETWRDYVSCCHDVIYLSYSYGLDDTTVTDSSSTTNFGAGIFAGSLNASGFSLTNAGSRISASPDAMSESGAAGDSLASGANAVSGSSGMTFGGITITLPTNPNGFFVISQDPNSHYLIETNPRFADPNAMGSDYLAKRFGIDPDTTQRRLGDANYETNLVRQQLIAQTGSNIIVSGQSEAQQMQHLMDNGADQGKAMGLTYGKPLTDEQIANLSGDMVWMVEKEVNGQKVLAPVVYLSQATKDAISGNGTVIAANNVNMNLDSLTNSGGTIQGTNTLTVTAKGDITNESGKIKGGDVDLKSTEGSIINKTYSETTGSEGNMNTVVGDKSSIEATGNLKLDASKDISNIGADMSAGGDADLKAGGNITFDTVEDKKSSSTHEFSGGNTFNNSESSTTTTTTTNVRSGLKVGGNLKTDSGGDTTFAGTDADIGGDANIKAGGDLNFLSRDDSKTTTTSSTHTGLGVGGGVYGTESEDTTNYQSRNKGTNFNVGGDGTFTSDGTMTVQGSDLSTGGDMNLKADDIKVIEGRDVDRTTTTKSTTTFLSMDDGEANAPEEKEADEGDEKGGSKVSAEASAETEAHDAGGVNLSDTKTTTTDHLKSTSVGSNLKSGGNMKVESNKDLTVRGSNVEAGGDVDINAKNVNIQAAEDIDTTTTTTTRTQVGLYGNSDNKAGASAGASAYADDGGASADSHGNGNGAGANVNAGNASAGAEANAKAEASTDNTVDLMRHSETATTTTDITHTGSSIKSGGNMNVKADNKLNVNGSDMESGGDMNLKAKDMSFTAAEDSHTTTTSSSKTAVGLYAEGKASAEAGAKADAGAKTGASGEIGGEAGADAGVGLQGRNTTASSTEGSTTARTSTLKSGGNMTRDAEGKITDEGTQIEAGGDFTQNATEWDSKAAKNTTFSSSTSETNSAKLGLYGEANASAKASGEATIGKPGTETESEAGASAGIKASYNRKTDDESSSTSEAVTSSIKSGGRMKSTTTGATTLEGTNMESGGDMELNAGSLDYKAAKNTSSSSSSSSNIDGEVKVGVDATKAVTGSLSGGYDAERESESSTEAVTGSMKSGGKLKVNTTGDARFEGTNLESADDASVKAGGDVKFDAAHNTSESSKGSENVKASISASKSKGSGTEAGLEAEGGFDRSSKKSDDAVAGSIKSGGKLNVSAGGDASFEGTNLESQGDMGVDAGGDVNFNAAKSTSSEEEYGASASLSAKKGKKGDGNEAGFEAEGNYRTSDSTTSEAGSLKSGGAIKVKSGKDTNLEGTNIESTGKTSIDAGGDVNFKAAEDTSTSFGVEAGISAKSSKDEEAGKGGASSGSGSGNGEKETKNKKEGSASLTVEGSKSNTKKEGSINAGSIEINAGDDASFEGTKLNSAGDASVKAGGDVNFNAAESSSIDGSFSGSAGTEGSSLKDAGIGGGVQKKGAEINTGGNLNIESGGKTTFEGTQADVGGTADIDAQGGVEKKTNVSGGAQLGTSRAGASLDVQQTNIKAKGGVNE